MMRGQGESSPASTSNRAKAYSCSRADRWYLFLPCMLEWERVEKQRASQFTVDCTEHSKLNAHAEGLDVNARIRDG